MPIVALALAGSIAMMPQRAAAENLFDFLFGGFTKPQRQQQGNGFDPFGNNPQAQPQPRTAASGSGPAFCVRTCDGRYFPLMRGLASPAQMCQAFCPASATKVYFGSSIDYAAAANGERYADSENAFAYRKALRADCTCNGRDPAGLAPVDLALDNSLRPGDVVATTEGLVAYTGPRGGTAQAADFTPVASYPGLTNEVRARLTELKVAPVRADIAATDPASADITASVAPPLSIAPKAVPGRDKRAEMD
ncbi:MULTISPECIES: DUF2865 domain-containing protein [unclassified Bradyrhizobium]|uniref:DUF2865 domain-containing protein n=1 Tax=unclassified Bradyrhizobium TaxID=2631580 RepID=UPI0028EE0CA5|nr:MULTISPECIES: DUF2865 domain-containing protein [unclassified Bradyrhizobium]